MVRITQIRPHTILISIIVAIFVIVIAINFFFGGVDQISNAKDERGNLHALISIEDSEGVVSTQFFILNTQTKRGALIDIPPYLGAILDQSDNLDRIDRLVAENNFSEYLAEIEGFTEKTIDFYLRFTVEEFISLIDLIEGVRLFIISSPGGETQLLPSGDVVLDGRKIEEYIDLYRNEQDGKLQIEGLQELIYRTLLAISDNRDYLSHRDVFDYFYQIVRTNLRKNDLHTLLTDIMYGITEEGVQSWVTQGDVRSVVVGDRRESLLFPDLNGRWIAQTVAQVGSQIVHRRALGSGSEGVRIRILNGTPISGLARRTKLLYEQFGYTVVEVDNYQTQNIPNTQLINYGVSQEIARDISAVISMDAERIEQADAGENTEYEFTLILGNDFDGVTVNASG